MKKHRDGLILVKKRQPKLTAAPENLFIVNEDCKKLSMEAAASFHAIVPKILYVSKQARPDTSLSIAFLTTRVRAPNTDD